jgi:RNA polymerase sigma factor (TIGR02999 family)
MDNPSLDITAWLNGLASTDSAPSPMIGAALFERVYEDLRRVARGHMRRENAGHTLSSTALTHEAWFQMSAQTRTHWASRSHFLAVTSTVMRRILVHHAVAKRAAKRDVQLVALNTEVHQDVARDDTDVVALHEVLLVLESIDPRAARVVELRFFGGMENAEIAEALGISLATVKREWQFASAWLARELVTQ